MSATPSTPAPTSTPATSSAALFAFDDDPASGDAVTHYRREMKFACPGADPRKLFAILEPNTRPVAFGAEPVSRVSSLYFDDDRLASARESLHGVSRRVKLRLRWYDQPLPDGRVFFEAKRRAGAYIVKDRFALRLAASLGRVDALELVDRLAAVLPEPQATLLRLRPVPTTLVSYRRRHFRDPESGVRITVDWDIAGYDQLGGRRIARTFPAPLHDVVVIEAKASMVDEKHVTRLLYPLKPRVTRSSKYVQCCFQHRWGTLVD
jgi:hypothetical protein